MPVGKINNPLGPAAQATLGTVTDTDEKNHFILNNANLKKGEPVLFDIRAFDLEIDGQKVKIKIAVLEVDEKGVPLIRQKPWPKKFRDKWYKEWGNIDDEKIKKLKIKHDGKILDKRNILAIQDEVKGQI